MTFQKEIPTSKIQTRIESGEDKSKYSESDSLRPEDMYNINFWQSKVGRWISLVQFAIITLSIFLLFSVLIYKQKALESKDAQFIASIPDILLFAAIASFASIASMIIVHYKLIRPILYIKYALQKSSENPEKPVIEEFKYRFTDEMQSALQLTHSVILQNSTYIQRIKNHAQDQIHRLAYYDPLTQLPNRSLFLTNLEEKVKTHATALRQGAKLGVIVIDLDHFRDINDSMGHDIGNEILITVGKRLVNNLPSGTFVGRIGEDEFAAFLPIGEENQIVETAKKIQSLICDKPIKAFDEAFSLRCSLGVAFLPDHGDRPELALKNADIALNRAKEDGRNLIRQYLVEYDTAVNERFNLLRDLSHALENDDLDLYIQPKICLKTDRVIGAEALLRWFKKDPDLENGGYFISPVEIIPLAEKSGLIVPLGEWVLQKTCEIAKMLEDRNTPVQISANVSGAQFHQTDISNYIANILKDLSLSPSLLEIEMTESVFMSDMDKTVQTLKNLNDLGIEIAIDDFGTGYSSLAYLRQFPIDRLKIDRAFIDKILTSEDDASIARTIITLGHALNLKVTAEGVETEEHVQFLKGLNCDEAQGYLYAKPLPYDDFLIYLDANWGEERKRKA